VVEEGGLAVDGREGQAGERELAEVTVGWVKRVRERRPTRKLASTRWVIGRGGLDPPYEIPQAHHNYCFSTFSSEKSSGWRAR